MSGLAWKSEAMDDGISWSSNVFRSVSMKEEIKKMETWDSIQVKGANHEEISYNVVTGQIPLELEAALSRPLTEQERKDLYYHVDLLSAEHLPLRCRPKALWIFGPPASGKSTMAEELSVDFFGRPHNAVVVDGDYVRSIHEGFQAVAEHGLRNRLVHADAWSICKQSKVVQAAKKEVFRTAIKNRQHLKIPDCSLNRGRILAMLDELEKAGYELYAICLWAPEVETKIRGRARSVKEGKVFSVRNYRAASYGAVEMGSYFLTKIEEGGNAFKAVAFYDNTVRPSHPVHMAQFELLTKLTSEQEIQHVEMCRSTRDAHNRADVAASEARARGTAPSSVAKLWLKWATTPPQKTPDDTAERDEFLSAGGGSIRRISTRLSITAQHFSTAARRVGSFGPANGAAPAFTAHAAAGDLGSLVLAERRLGRLQGVVLGLLIFVALDFLFSIADLL